MTAGVPTKLQFGRVKSRGASSGWESMRKVVSWGLLSGLALTVAWASACRAATSTTLDLLPNEIAGPSERIEIGNLKPLALPNRDNAKPAVSGNPLWSVPLSALTATQERPIFSASRRPPPRAVAGPQIEPEVLPAPSRPAEPEHPPLALIGAVVGDRDAIAVFVDRSGQGVVRLRAGETHAGWLLSSVQPREVTFRKDDLTEVLALQSAAPPAAAAVAATGLPAPVVPTTVSGATFAPFTPRSTPKNGESDGL